MNNYQSIQQEEYTVVRSRRKWKYILAGIVAFPLMVYVFIYLPARQTTRVELPKLKKYDQLPVNLLDDNKRPTNRIILIGDVHGSYNPLQKLLTKLNYTSNDTVVLLGDYLSKGPDSLKVLDFAMENKFYGVLGNHELSILAKYSGYKPINFIDDDQFNFTILSTEGIKFDGEMYISKKLTPDHINYITSMPLVLGMGPVPLENNRNNKSTINGLASHLGLLVDFPIDTQPITKLLNIDRDWFKDYNQYEKKLPKRDRNAVYYGHHASLGLNLRKFTKGLDSGCVYGGELSSMVIWAEEIDGEIIYKQELVSVGC